MRSLLESYLSWWINWAFGLMWHQPLKLMCVLLLFPGGMWAGPQPFPHRDRKGVRLWMGCRWTDGSVRVACHETRHPLTLNTKKYKEKKVIFTTVDISVSVEWILTYNINSDVFIQFSIAKQNYCQVSLFLGGGYTTDNDTNASSYLLFRHFR